MPAFSLGQTLWRTFNRVIRDWFLVGMLGAVALASLFPGLGKSGGLLHVDQVTDVGIALVFFLHGLGLSLTSLRDGLLRWRVHVLVQLFTFAVFPLLWWLANAALGDRVAPGLVLGFCYLCVLPSTISSSVAMTGLARGNVPAAIFNATLSTLIGVVMTPLLITLLVGNMLDGGNGAGGHAHSLADASLAIARLLLLPLVVGMALRPALHKWHVKFKRYTNLLDRFVILLLVFGAFCNSVASGVWRDQGLEVLAETLAGVAVLLAIVLVLTTWTARRLGFATEDEITAVFCGSKKTLASGVPMAKLLFGAHPALGLIVLPIMLYHQLQLFVCSVLASRYGARER